MVCSGLFYTAMSFNWGNQVLTLADQQVTAATGALEWSTPPFPEFPDGYERPERALDVFDFLQYVFGFQVCMFSSVQGTFFQLLFCEQAVLVNLPDPSS